MSRRAPTAPGLALLLAVLAVSSTLGQEGKVAGRIVAITDGDTCKALIAANQLLRILHRMLSNEQFKVQTSHSVADALAAIEQKPFDVYVMDYKLPDG
jgi:hypothetical protein